MKKDEDVGRIFRENRVIVFNFTKNVAGVEKQNKKDRKEKDL